VAIVAGPFFLFGIILPAYWAAEFEIHSSIWAIFPQPIKSDVAFTFKEAVDCHQLMIAAPNAASRPTK
jgi:hypothetical protein